MLVAEECFFGTEAEAALTEGHVIGFSALRSFNNVCTWPKFQEHLAAAQDIFRLMSPQPSSKTSSNEASYTRISSTLASTQRSSFLFIRVMSQKKARRGCCDPRPPIPVQHHFVFLAIVHYILIIRKTFAMRNIWSSFVGLRWKATRKLRL